MTVSVGTGTSNAGDASEAGQMSRDADQARGLAAEVRPDQRAGPLPSKRSAVERGNGSVPSSRLTVEGRMVGRVAGMVSSGNPGAGQGYLRRRTA